MAKTETKKVTRHAWEAIGPETVTLTVPRKWRFRMIQAPNAPLDYDMGKLAAASAAYMLPHWIATTAGNTVNSKRNRGVVCEMADEFAALVKALDDGTLGERERNSVAFKSEPAWRADWWKAHTIQLMNHNKPEPLPASDYEACLKKATAFPKFQQAANDAWAAELERRELITPTEGEAEFTF